tara:strand:+ start:809 stop:1018 length:210 start_codon:yes stop_codon:yes gene_type:complete
VKPRTSLTLRQQKIVKTGDWMIVFNEIHNSHLSMNVGQVDVKTNDKRMYSQKKDHGNDMTYENEFKVKK